MIEGKVGSYTQQKIEVTQFGQEILTNNQKVTDLDIVTPKHIIEVKKSASSIKTDQIDRLIDYNNPQFFNFESKKILVYFDEPIQNITNPKTLEKIEYLRNLESQNKITILNSLDNLGEELK
ncbi:hypothetical protein ACYSNR_18160 [Enterococcus sp. LJL128]